MHNDFLFLGDLDRAILQTLLEMGGLSARKQLDLSLKWNRNDMVEQILMNERDNISDNDIDELLTKTLIDNKLEFTKIFAEMINFREYLTIEKLEKIYNETLKVTTELFLLQILEKAEGKTAVPKPDHTRKAIMTAFNIDYVPQLQEKAVQGTESISARYSNPEIEMFVYSLLFIRPEASEYFWENTLCKTSAALFAILVCKTILNSSVSRLDMSLQLKIESMLKNYEFRAAGILNSCYDVKVDHCHTILKIKHNRWGNKTCLDLAIQADCREFISQSGCQTLAQEDWYGKLSYRNSFWKILGVTVMPLLMPLLWFKTDDSTAKAAVYEYRKRTLGPPSHNDSWQARNHNSLKIRNFSIQYLTLND